MNTNIGVNAATGRMGQQIIEQISKFSDVKLAAAFCRSGHPFFEKIVRNSNNIRYTNDIVSGLSQSQVIIDFSLPSVSLALLEAACVSKTPILVGTTGFNDKQLSAIAQISTNLPVLLAPNTSIGVNTTLSLLAKAASLIGKESDIEIIEAHHNRKIDAPSGTAIKMGEVICETMGTQLSQQAVYQRTNKKRVRSTNEIGFSAIRAGSIIGEHKVIFGLANETISIEHKAQSRKCFAEGAVKAAIWLAKQDNGLYSMQDFLS